MIMYKCKSKKNIIFQLSIIFLLILNSELYVNAKESFTPNQLALKEKVVNASDKTLSNQQVQKDIGLLLYALQNGYSGYRFLPKLQIDLLESKLKMLPSLHDSIAPLQLCNSIQDIFDQMSDYHLNVRINDVVCHKQKPVKKDAVGKNLGSQLWEEKKIPWKISILDSHPETPILSIIKFPFQNDPSWKGFSESIKTLLSYKSIVIDLRGNDGGDDSRGYELARLLHGGKIVFPKTTHIQLQTSESLILFRNSFQFILNKLRDTPENLPKEREQMFLSEIQKLDAKLTLAQSNQIPQTMKEHIITDTEGYENGTPYTGKIFVLVDSQCISSCESTFEILRTHPQAKSFGQPTAGKIHFGNVGKLLLPNSGILVQIGTKYYQYDDGSFFEKAGYPVDVSVKDGQSALDVTVQHLAVK